LGDKAAAPKINGGHEKMQINHKQVDLAKQTEFPRRPTLNVERGIPCLPLQLLLNNAGKMG